MPINGYSVGRDVSVQIFGSGGSIVTFNKITAFDKKQVTSKVTVRTLKDTQYLEIPEGWDGTISIERTDSNVDDYIATLESNYYAGVNIAAAQITETITEVNGSTTQYRYTGVMFKLDDGGAFEGDKTVKQKLSWCASKRLKVK